MDTFLEWLLVSELAFILVRSERAFQIHCIHCSLQSPEDKDYRVNQKRSDSLTWREQKSVDRTCVMVRIIRLQ